MQCVWNKSTLMCLSCKLWITVLYTLFGWVSDKADTTEGSLVGTSKYIISFQSYKTQLHNPQKNLSHPQQFIQITLWYRTWYTFFLSYFMSPLISHHYHHHNKCSLLSPDRIVVIIHEDLCVKETKPQRPRAAQRTRFDTTLLTCIPPYMETGVVSDISFHTRTSPRLLYCWRTGKR